MSVMKIHTLPLVGWRNNIKPYEASSSPESYSFIKQIANIIVEDNDILRMEIHSLVCSFPGLSVSSIQNILLR